MSARPCVHIPSLHHPKAECIFSVCACCVNDLTCFLFPSLSVRFVSEQERTNRGVFAIITGRVLPQAREADRRDEPRTGQWLWARAQADAAVQWTRPQSLSERERPSKESEWLAGTPSLIQAQNLDSQLLSGVLFYFLHWEINGYLISRRTVLSPPDVDWTGGGGVPGGERAKGTRSLKAELEWAASHLSVSAVHS